MASRFDADGLTPSQAAVVVKACAQMVASIESVKALAAARLAQSASWQDLGFRSPSHQLAEMAGMSPSNARRSLQTGQRLATQPEVAQAALAGDLSPEQATAVADGVAANPDKAAELIERAKELSLPELNLEIARSKAAGADAEARRAALVAERGFRHWTDRDGAFQAHLYGLPEHGAQLAAMLDPIRRHLNTLRRTSGAPNDTFEALDYDALMTIAAVATGAPGQIGFSEMISLGLFPPTPSAHDRSGASGADADADADADSGTSTGFGYGSGPGSGSSTASSTASSTGSGPGPGRARSGGPPELFPPLPAPAQPPLALDRAGIVASASDSALSQQRRLAGSPTQIVVHVSADTLLRGYPIDGELCEIVGYGPVPVAVIEDLAANGNTFIVGVLTKAKQVIGIYKPRRRPNTYQRAALDFVYPTCAAQGCNAKTSLQYDHRIDWAKTHFTAYDLMDRLCAHHHNLKTRKNWALVDGHGKRPFVAPTDPRHPNHAKHAKHAKHANHTDHPPPPPADP